MYECFIAAVVPGEDVQQARSVLHGVTGKTEQHAFTRILYANSLAGVGLSTIKTLQKDRVNGKLWFELHQILLRQSYIVSAHYSVDENVLKGGSEPTSLAGRPGLLRFLDLPDSVANKAAIHTQRKLLEIHVPDLERFLTDNKFIRESETIEETYSWWHGGNEHVLRRAWLPLAPAVLQQPTLPAQLPPPASTAWILTTRTVVPDPTPETMQKALARLGEARETLGGCFAYRAWDKLLFDTRNIDRQGGRV